MEEGAARDERGPSPRDAWIMVALVAAAAGLTIAFGERIGVNGGLGWDGKTYGGWAVSYWRAMAKGVTEFQAQRVLPSGIVHYLLRAFGVTRTVPHVILGFQLFDALLLVGSAVVWWRIALLLELSRRAAWIGFVALFGSFAGLKQALYYPCLTDTAAFALATAMVWAFLGRRHIVLFLLIALSALTWPSLPVFGSILLILPRPRQPLVDDAAAPNAGAPRWLPWAAIAAGVAAAAAIGLATYHYAYGIRLPFPGQRRWLDMAERSVWPLTFGLVLAYVGLGVHALARPAASWRLLAYARDLGWRHLAVTVVAAAALFAGRAWVIHNLGRAGSGATTSEYVGLILITSLRGPLVHVVMSVVYYGPIVLIAVAAWRRAGAVLAGWGPGALLAAAMAIVQSLGSESRQFIHVIPFIVTATVLATRARWRSTPFTALFIALTLAWSKVWFTIGYDKPINPYAFPNQRFSMHQGPWSSTTMYLIHGAAMLATAALLVLAVLLRRRPAPATG